MRKSAYLISVAVAAIAAPSFAQTGPVTTPQEAQVATQATAPAAAAENFDPSDIIVTATRRSERLSNVPIAVSAVSQETLQNSGGSDIRALNQLAPSLLISSTGSESNASARIRGVGTVGDNPGLESSVAVFIDGVYRSRTGVGLNELGEIDRVEVLRGPQGTLFGRNASAGLINIITRAPSFTFGGNAEGTYGNYDQKRIALGLTGPITDTLAARVDAVYVNRDGFYRNVTQGGGSESRINNRDRYFIRGQLLFKPTADLSFRLIGDYSHRKESCCGATYYGQQQTVDPTPDALQANGSSVNVDHAVAVTAANPIVDILRRAGAAYPLAGNTPGTFNREAALTPGQTYRNTTVDYGGSLQADWNLGPATLTSITAYREYKSGNAGDVDYTNVDIAHRADDGNAYRQFHTFTQELRLQGSAFDGKLDWLVGGFYSKEKLKLVDNSVFGAQYGEFAACRLVANISQNAVLQNNTAPGCLSPTGRATVTGAFGALAPAVLGGLDRLSTMSNVGDVRSVYRQTSENFAGFTHNIFRLTDTVSLTLGARYTHEQKDFRANFNNNNTVCPVQQANLSPLLASAAVPAAAKTFVGGILTLSCTGNSSSTLNALNLNNSFGEGKVTGTAVLSWKPIPSLLTYASYAKGYKSGGYNLDRSPLGGAAGVFSPRSNADAAGLKFDAETVNSYELGAKFKTRGFTLNVAAFRSEFKNFQLNTFNGSVFVVQNLVGCSSGLNGGDTDNLAATGQCTGKADKPGVISQGVELEATMSPIRQFQVSAGYTFADTRIARNLVGNSRGAPLDPALFLLPGSQLSNAPRHVVTTSVAWTPDLGTNGMSGLLYVDNRLTSDYNTGSDLAPEKKQDGFALVNARVGIRGKDQLWAIEFWAQNVFNKQYIQVAFNTPFQGAGSSANVAHFGGTGNALYSAFLAEPRTYGLTLRSRF